MKYDDLILACRLTLLDTLECLRKFKIHPSDRIRGTRCRVLLESINDILVIAQHLLPRIFRISVHSSKESFLLLESFVDDVTESSSKPGVVATIHLANVGIKISETPPGIGGSTHTSFHAFGAIDIKNSATDLGIVWDEDCGHQTSASCNRALLWVKLNRPSCLCAVEQRP